MRLFAGTVTASIKGKIDFFQNHHLFCHFRTQQLQKLSYAFCPRRCRLNEMIISEGDVADTIYFIYSGECKVTKRESDLSVVQAGHFFGIEEVRCNIKLKIS